MYKLTQSGLLTSIFGDVVLSDIIKRFKESKNYTKSITYDKERGELVIQIKYDEIYKIELTPEQKFNFENNIRDPQLNRIRDLIAFNDEREFANDTIAAANRGELPVTTKGINIYSNYLNTEIVKSGAVIAKSFVVSYWPLLLILFSIPMWKLAGKALNMGDVKTFAFGTIAFALDFAGLGFGACKIEDFSKSKRLVFLEEAKEELETIKINLLKKQDLRTWERDLNKPKTTEEIIADNSCFISEEKKKETDKAIENNDETLGEIKQILDLIRQLPVEEQDEYAERIIEITKDYQEKITRIINNDRGLSFGLAGDVHSLRYEIMPSLIAIRNEIEEKLYRQEKLKKVTEECESIISAAEESPYNEWSDDLTEGNVAKMY